MLQKDNYDLGITVDSADAYRYFIIGLDESLGLDSSGIESFIKSLSFEPDFALAYALLAKQLAIYGSPIRAKQYLDLALHHKHKSSLGEQSAINIISMLIENKTSCLDAALEHIHDYPNDTIILPLIVGPFGLLAFSGSLYWRERNLKILKGVESSFFSDDWWFKTTQAFMFVENGEIKKASTYGQIAWDIKNTGNCAHTLTHIHYESSKYKEGRQFIKEWRLSFKDSSNMLHHIEWHNALLSLKLNKKDEIFPIFEKLISNKDGVAPLEYLADNISLLWYCIIEDIIIPRTWNNEMHKYIDKYFPDIGFKFVDLHRSMLAATGSSEEREAYLKWIETEDNNARSTLTELTQGFIAFFDGNYSDSIRYLEKIEPFNAIYGGSNVQRYIIGETNKIAHLQKI